MKLPFQRPSVPSNTAMITPDFLGDHLLRASGVQTPAPCATAGGVGSRVHVVGAGLAGVRAQIPALGPTGLGVGVPTFIGSSQSRGDGAQTPAPSFPHRAVGVPTPLGAARSIEDMINKSETEHTSLAFIMDHEKGHPSVHQHLNLQWLRTPNSRSLAPPPTEVVRTLRGLAVQGNDIGDILDQVSRSRAALSVRDASQRTYMSHLKTVCAVCDLLQVQVVPASVSTIRRYTAICNNAATLRGHLAAWQLVHTVMGIPWAGSRDHFIRAAQAGLTRWQPNRPQRMAIRLDLTSRIVDHCFRSGSRKLILFGIMAALAYLFALRVPSELLRQATLQIIGANGEQLSYGPINRKQAEGLVTLRRQCLCQSKHRKLCPHTWLPSLSTARLDRRQIFSDWSCASFNECLRNVLCQLGLPVQTARMYCSHDFRRGCAKDMLHFAGPAAMLQHCGWRSSTAALHYVTRDEVHASVLASVIAEASDEDR